MSGADRWMQRCSLSSDVPQWLMLEALGVWRGALWGRETLLSSNQPLIPQESHTLTLTLTASVDCLPGSGGSNRPIMTRRLWATQTPRSHHSDSLQCQRWHLQEYFTYQPKITLRSSFTHHYSLSSIEFQKQKSPIVFLFFFCPYNESFVCFGAQLLTGLEWHESMRVSKLWQNSLYE